MLLFVLFPLFALLAAASPINGTNTTSTDDDPDADLIWSGVVPGHGPVTLSGCAHAVEQQIFALNPSLKESLVIENPFMPEHPQPFNASYMTSYNGSYYLANATSDGTIAARTLPEMAARSPVPVDGSKVAEDGYTALSWGCGTFSSANYYEGFSAVALVNSPGGVYGGTWTIPRNFRDGTPNCRRLSCGREPAVTHTGVYWCNNNPFPVTALGTVLSSVAGMVSAGWTDFGFYGCCLTSQFQYLKNTYSGQVFIGNGTNIVVSYADCKNSDVTRAPSSYPMPGPLPACV